MILAGDVGGTKTLLALFDAQASARRPQFERRYGSAEFQDFVSLAERFLADAREALGAAPALEGACFGIAGPVAGRRVRVTNLPWTVDAERLERRLGVPQVKLMNDFAAAACGLEALGEEDLVTLQAGEPLADAPRVLIGAGTGLGIAFVLAGAGGAQVLPGEGGHAGFAPASREQAALWQHLEARHGRVTLEHVLSGEGLERIYRFLRTRGALVESAALGGELERGGAAAAITRHALEQGDELALAALDLFIACYGAAAGDQALTVLARGGVYVAGGIAPKILPRLAAGGFVAAFNDKAEFAEHCAKMPLHVVTNEKLGLIGAARAAGQAA